MARTYLVNDEADPIADGKIGASDLTGTAAPESADYLVGTANASLSAEIVVGTSPGGELGGTWASPTVDATHSGSSHADTQAAAEATAASALSTHTADVDAHHAKYTDAEAIAAVEGEATLALTGNVTTTGNITAGSGVISALTVSAERVITEFPLACKLTQGSDQTVGTASNTTATWDAVAYDQGTNWGLSAMADLTNERIYIRRRGLYDIKAQYAFDPSSSGGRVIRIYWYDVSAASATLLAEYEARSEAGARDGTTHACVEHSFDTADDYIYVEVYQNSGGNLNSVPAKCWFSARYIGDYIT